MQGSKQGPMPQTPRYELVAQIVKTKGLNGQLVAQEMGGLSILCPGLEVWVVPPTLEGVRHTVVLEAQDNFKKHGALISLDGVDDRTRASELIGRYLLAATEQVEAAVRLSDSQPDEEGEGLPASLSKQADGEGKDVASAALPRQAKIAEGVSFVDEAYGDLGHLDSIKPGPAYDIWVVEGPHGRLEIPAVAEYLAAELVGGSVRMGEAGRADAGERTGEAVRLSLPYGFIETTAVRKAADQQDAAFGDDASANDTSEDGAMRNGE